MFPKKALCILVITLLAGLSALWAGDTATFVDLGFSRDGRTYMFGQFGVQSETLRPWADLFIVDVETNSFVSGGRSSFVHDRPIVAGQNGSGALFHLIAQNSTLAAIHNIDNTFQGKPLFISLDTRPDDPPGTIEFRDFENGSFYRASLVSRVEGSSSSFRSSFHINLERIERDGSVRTFQIGNPQLMRPSISAYHIRQVIIPPSSGSMIFVIEMIVRDGEHFDVRYMVEAVRF